MEMQSSRKYGAGGKLCIVLKLRCVLFLPTVHKPTERQYHAWEFDYQHSLCRHSCGLISHVHHLIC